MLRRGFGLLLLPWVCAIAPAQAMDFAIGELTGSLRGQVSVGAAVRTETQNPELIGKLNQGGNEQFCEDKDPTTGLPAPVGSPPGINCQTVAGNAAFLALPGIASVNTDNGDLNYNRGDLINAAFKLAPRLSLTYGDYGLDVSGLYFYDAVNYHFTEFHPSNTQDNNGFQPRETRRAREAEGQIGSHFQLGNAYVSGNVPLPGDRQLSLKIGNQVLSLGTSTLLVFNSLNTVNPPDANVRFLPGSDLREVFVRVPLAVANVSLNESISALGFYEFGWKHLVPPPIGSFYSTNDVLGAGHPYVGLLFGKYREDPDNLVGVEERTQGNANLLSDAGRTVYEGPERRASHQGQYGFNLSYFAQELNGTTFNLTYLNLHSRFPFLGFSAAQKGCAHDASNAADAALACGGFNSPVHHGGTASEVVPIDTVKFVFDYPEDIHALGLSFSTNLGEVAWTGEVVFRPNQPLQVDPTDVGMAALQPVFPATNIVVGVPTNVPGLPVPTGITIPARRTAVPDYIEHYRNHTPAAGEYIPGYERMKTIAYDTSFLYLTGASGNWFRADQLTALLELGAFQVLDMPDLDTLQFAAPGVQFHHSAGVDSTGTPTPEQTETDPSNRLNPQYQASGFATSLSYGYRVLTQLTYEDVLPGLRVLPQLAWFHDLYGKSPLPTGEFVAGRKQGTVGVSLVYLNDWTASVRYNFYFGGGRSNVFEDRDNVAVQFAYDF
ncbi:MAG TPA: DUF1302 family protein [Nevskiaceae bacterium]|nr:DUF1302 family protein [Nevskiaceae bacterium]